jgi:diguanylate cyclase (GGDEF)-like protein/PAS domain S-box-containing protein
MKERGDPDREAGRQTTRAVQSQTPALRRALTELAADNEALVVANAQANAELVRRQRFTDALLETIGVGIVSCDAVGGSIVSNRAARVISGVPGGPQSLSQEEAPSGVDVLDMDGKSVAVEDYPLIRALRGEDVGAVELLLGPVGGPHREFVTNGVQIVDADGAVIGAVSAMTDVSAERAAARALTEAQRLGQIGSFEFDFGTGVWTYSAQLPVLWGVAPGGVTPDTFLGLISESDRDQVAQNWRADTISGGRHERVYRIVRASDGAERVIRSIGEVTLGPDGQPVHGRGTHQDITDLTVAERSALRATAFFDAVLTASPDYTCVSELATGAVVFRSRAETLLGFSGGKSEAFDPDGAALIHPDDQPELQSASIASAGLADGEVLQVRYRGRHADGGWRWLSRRITPFRRDDAGSVVEVLSVVRDISGTVAAEEQLAEADRVRWLAEARLQIGFDQAGIGAAILGLDGIPIRVNAALCALLGRPAELLIGRLWTGYYHPDEEPPAQVVQAQLAAGNDTFGDERRFIRPDGSIVWASTTVSVVRDQDGAPDYLFAQLADMTERKELEHELTHLALHDSLTGLPNRALLTDRLVHSLARSHRRHSQLGVLFLDVDRFKLVNDSLGHSSGDDLLRQAAARIQAVIRPDDTLARFGGDEFVVVCDDLSQAEVEQIAGRILEQLIRPWLIGDQEITVTASLGIAIAGPDATPESLLRESDAAMHQAKERGRGRVEIFDEALRVKATNQLATASALALALERDEFTVYYQPIVDLFTGEMVSAEALLRWEHPDRGLVSPAEFIPLAEESGLIVPIGAWVLEQACNELVTWQRHHPTMTISVNLSVRQVLAPDIATVIQDIVQRTGASPEHLCLELTESVFMEDVDYFARTLSNLKSLGVQLSIDDFGTGYSSLSYLKRFPVDAVKIDRAFVDGLGTDPHHTALVAAILAMADALDLDVTAEGIETPDQLAHLKRLHCRRAQGYYLARPMPAHAMNTLLADRHHWPVD